MRITFMGVVIVIGGVLLLVVLVEHLFRTSDGPRQNEPKADSDEQSNLS
jgi:TRAP-type C4-dicarboxylate transport system permease small subunit